LAKSFAGEWKLGAVNRGEPGRSAAALGVAVFSGMLGVTFFGVFLTPVFFYVLRRHADRAEVAVQPKE
jgi:hypothetical protein